MDEKPPSLTGFVVESFEVILDEKFLLGRNNLWGEKSCWMKNLQFRPGLLLRILKWFWLKNSCLGETILGGGKSYWMKTSKLDWFDVVDLEVVLVEKLWLG